MGLASKLQSEMQLCKMKYNMIISLFCQRWKNGNAKWRVPPSRCFCNEESTNRRKECI